MIKLQSHCFSCFFFFFNWPCNWGCSFCETGTNVRASQVAPVVKDPPAKAGDMGSIPESGRSPEGGHHNPLQHPCPENPVDRGARLALVHRVAKSQTRLKQLSTCAQHQCTSLSWYREVVLAFMCYLLKLLSLRDLMQINSWSHRHQAGSSFYEFMLSVLWRVTERN